MKIKVTTVEEIEIDITYPCYMQSSCHYFKLNSETNIICVTDLIDNYSISVSNIEIAFMNNNIKSSKEIFDRYYNKVLTILNNLNNNE